MKQIKIPKRYNYIGAFLTFRCQLNCSYCINKFEKLVPTKELNGTGWVEGLQRLNTKADLPITLQGGEPTMHPHFYFTAKSLHSAGRKVDLLTNGDFNAVEFCDIVGPQVFKRRAKYASIRFSFHSKTVEESLLSKVSYMKKRGYSVGVWGLNTPIMHYRNRKFQMKCNLKGIDFRLKDFINHGWSNNIYKYPASTVCLGRHKAWCKPSELLIGPNGYIFRCHRDLYANEHSVGYIIEDKIKFPGYLACSNYGHCNPCDVKIKNNRFQKWGYTAVKIKERRR